MKRIVPAALLLFGCIALGPSSASEGDPSVRIIADEEPTSHPPMIVSFRAQTAGLTPPLRFHWNLGNGKEWDRPLVPQQLYEPGRYDIALTVSDAAGHVRKASIAVDSKSSGCSGI